MVIVVWPCVDAVGDREERRSFRKGRGFPRIRRLLIVGTLEREPSTPIAANAAYRDALSVMTRVATSRRFDPWFTLETHPPKILFVTLVRGVMLHA